MKVLQKIAQSGRFGRGEYLLRRSLLNDCARIHKDHSVGDLPRECHFVGYNHHRHTLRCQRSHRIKDLLDEFRVQSRGRLVKQNQLRLHGESSGYRDALLLPSGQLAWALVQVLGQEHFS